MKPLTAEEIIRKMKGKMPFVLPKEYDPYIKEAIQLGIDSNKITEITEEEIEKMAYNDSKFADHTYCQESYLQGAKEMLSYKMKQEWVSVEERSLSKEELTGNDHIDCWCFIPNHGVEQLAWNIHHECWDSADYDDVSRFDSRVTHYQRITIPSAPVTNKEEKE